MVAHTSSASGALPADMRAQFEHWVSENGRYPEALKKADAGLFKKTPSDLYQSMTVESAWMGWQGAYAAALASREATEDGYAKAFYEIASALGIGARADTPENVFRNEMLPKIKLMAEVFGDKYCADCRRTKGADPAAALASPQVAPALTINGQPPTAQSLLAAMVDIYDDAQKNPPEHRCYADEAWYEILGEARSFLAAPAPVAPTAEPLLWVSPEQAAAHTDPTDPEWDTKAGRYLPCRKTSAGKFTQPLYAAPVAPTPAQPSLQIPQGWKLVPMEPTEEMMDAAWDHTPLEMDDMNNSDFGRAYKDMLAAAPLPSEPEGESDHG